MMLNHVRASTHGEKGWEYEAKSIGHKIRVHDKGDTRARTQLNASVGIAAVVGAVVIRNH